MGQRVADDVLDGSGRVACAPVEGAQRQMARISGLEQALSEAMSGIAIFGVLLLAIPLVSGHHIDGVYLGFLALLALASFEAVTPLGQALQFLGRSLKVQVLPEMPEMLEPLGSVQVPDQS